MSTTVKNQRINLAEIQAGDVFSEMSHYSYIAKVAGGDPNKALYTFNHLESGNTITLDAKYVSELLQTADQYHEEVKVGKEDKLWTAKQIEEAVKSKLLSKDHSVRIGDIRIPGIRRIWSDIAGPQVFTVMFNKQDTMMSQKAYNEAKSNQLVEAITAIEAAKKAKKSISTAATEAIKAIQENPLSQIIKGEPRKLRGYKVQYESINGMYDVIDMDITSGMNVRKVNVNEITSLVISGVKYIVE